MKIGLYLALATILLPRSAQSQKPEDDSLEQMRRLIEDMAAGRPASSATSSHTSNTRASGTGSTGSGTGTTRTLQGLLGSGTKRAPVFEIPSGLRSLLLSQAPANIASIFSRGTAAAGSSSSSSSSREPTINLTAMTGAGYRGATSDKANPGAAAIQEAIDAATAAIVSNSLNAVSGIVYTVSGGLATLGAGFGIFTADFARQSSRGLFGISEYSFAQTLYNDFNGQIDGSDYLGDAAKYIKLWNKLKAELSTGQLTADMQGQMSQMATAQAILKAVVSNVVSSSPAN